MRKREKGGRKEGNGKEKAKKEEKRERGKEGVKGESEERKEEKGEWRRGQRGMIRRNCANTFPAPYPSSCLPSFTQ